MATITCVKLTYEAERFYASLGDCDPDDREETTYDVSEYAEINETSNVEETVTFLRDSGINEPSSVPTWSPGTWYSTSYDNAYGTRHYEETARLDGFTDDEQREIHARVQRS